MPNVMLDLEAMGTRPGSAIIAIGACTFKSDGIGEEFYTKISLKSCMDYDFIIDPSTVMWWMQQSDKARAEFKGNEAQTNIYEALGKFKDWLPEKSKIWGNGSDFDNTLLAEAYQRTFQPVPWNFWDNRCYRTMKNLAPNVPYEKVGTAHNALDDAKSQALHLIKIMAMFTGRG